MPVLVGIAALTALAALTPLAAAASAARPSPSPASGGGPRAAVDRLTGGAGSLEELLDALVAALRRGDRDALEELRVTESEYRRLILPGSVAPGAPPQVLRDDASAYFWTEMSQKSAAHREAILRRFGGRPLVRARYGFAKGIRDFAGYRAYRKLVLVLRDERGTELELHTGSIVERDGRFKLASFIRD